MVLNQRLSQKSLAQLNQLSFFSKLLIIMAPMRNPLKTKSHSIEMTVDALKDAMNPSNLMRDVPKKKPIKAWLNRTIKIAKLLK